MTIKTKTELLADIASKFPDNVIKAITPVIFRGFLTDVLDSYPETLKIVDKSALYTLNNTYDLSTLFSHSNSGAITVTLSEGSNFPDGFFCFLYRKDGAVGLAPSGADTINAQSQIVQIQQTGGFYILLKVGATEWLFYPVIPNFDTSKYLFGTTSGDDEGVNIRNGKFSVGTFTDPRKASFGGGCCYPIEKAFHFDGVSTYTDITNILRSDIASTTGLFGGITAGLMIYVGSDTIYRGVEVKVSALGNINPDNIIAEFWNDTLGWVDAPFMVTDSQMPYEQRADQIATISGIIENWRFMFDPEAAVSPWDKNTINGVEKYWGRFRIVSDITTDATIEQMKHHTDSFRVNEDGFTEYFGRSRYPWDLASVHLNLASPLNGFSPSDGAVEVSPSITFNMLSNKFLNTKIDGVGGLLEIPEGMDTSISVFLDIVFVVSDATVGDVDLEFITSPAKLGDVFDGTLAESSTHIQATVGGTANKSYKIRATLDVRKLLPGEFLAVAIKRDAGIGRVLDTYTGDITISTIKAIGYFWKS